MALGLLISASVNTSEKTMPLLVVLVMVEVILTGGVFTIAGKVGLEQVAWLSPSRGGFAATAATAKLNKFAMGLLLAVVITAAPVQDRDAARPLLWNLHRARRRIRLI